MNGMILEGLESMVNVRSINENGERHGKGSSNISVLKVLVDGEGVLWNDGNTSAVTSVMNSVCGFGL
jgi:hypothetical protein